MKSRGIERDVVARVREHGLEARTLVSSNHTAVVPDRRRRGARACRRRSATPRIATASARCPGRRGRRGRCRGRRGRRCGCAGRRCLGRSKAGVLALHKGLVSRGRRPGRCTPAARTVLTWTVNDPALVGPLSAAGSTRSAPTIRRWCSPSSAKGLSAARSSAPLATLIVAREAPPFHSRRSARPRCRRDVRRGGGRCDGLEAGLADGHEDRSRRRTGARRPRSRCTKVVTLPPSVRIAGRPRRPPRADARREGRAEGLQQAAARCRSTSCACCVDPAKLAKPYVDRRRSARARGEAGHERAARRQRARRRRPRLGEAARRPRQPQARQGRPRAPSRQAVHRPARLRPAPRPERARAARRPRAEPQHAPAGARDDARSSCRRRSRARRRP